MSERESKFDWVGLLITIAILAVVTFAISIAVDARTQLSQIRDLQRRVGQLEQQVQR